MLKIAWTSIYSHSLPENHRFPMIKYDLLPEQLIYEGTITEANLFAPHPLEERYITNTHDTHYWHRLKHQQLTKSEIRKTGFPLSEQLVQREITIAQGTVRATRYALEHGVAGNVAGGTHHAFTDRGEGFCLLNDSAIGANYLLEKKLATQVLIVDLDVHQGNGTAQIFRDQPKVYTFSMHGAKNYPMYKEQSDLDIPLPDGTDDRTYLRHLRRTLPRLMDEVQPDFVFFQSGVDVLATDKLGRLGLTMAGCKARDRFVLQTCRDAKVPVAINMGGGYSEKIANIVEAHANTYRLAQEIFF